MNDVATIQQQYQKPSSPTALDYGGMALSGVGTIASIYSAIQAEREAKRRQKMEEEQIAYQRTQQELQNRMAQEQILRNTQSQNRLLPSMQNQESMGGIQDLLNLYNQGSRSSVVGA